MDVRAFSQSTGRRGPLVSLLARPARTTVVFFGAAAAAHGHGRPGCAAWTPGRAQTRRARMVFGGSGGDDGRDDAAVRSAGGRSRRPCVSRSPDNDLRRRLPRRLTAFGVLAYALRFVPRRRFDLGRLAWDQDGPYTAALIVLAGIYELTPLKQNLPRRQAVPHDRGERGALGPAWRTACTALAVAWA